MLKKLEDLFKITNYIRMQLKRKKKNSPKIILEEYNLTWGK